MEIFELESIPNTAIDELMQLIAAAEEKSKIALVDLLRLLLQYEAPASRVIFKHWETIDLSIF